MITTTVEQNAAKIAAWRAAGSPRLTRSALLGVKARLTSAMHPVRVRQRGEWVEFKDRFGSWVRVAPIGLEWTPFDRKLLHKR
jgi:hypothetical protein